MDPQAFYDWRTKQAGEEKPPHRGVQIDHMSQAEAAEYFGVSRQTINYWERGTAPIPQSVEMVINGK